MKTDRNNELLDDVLSEATPPDFRAELLEATLRQVQRRKRNRKWNQRGLALACAITVAAVGVKFFKPGPKQIETAAASETFLVHSQPLSPEILVTTQTATTGIINSSDLSFAMVKSAPNNFQMIGDEDLFGLLTGKPVALVRHDFDTELVFLNPADRNGFPVH